MADKELPALSIALVDDQRTVWARGFGFADPERRVEATADTVYRVGSVSKLFTDIALMQLVEQGKVDLDAPVERYLPDFRPRNPFDRADHAAAADVAPLGPGARAAGRQLLRSDRAFPGRDHREPQPDDAGLSAGDAHEVLERGGGRHRLRGRASQRRAVRAVGEAHRARAARHATEQLRGDRRRCAPNLAKAYMWTIDGRVFPAPTFALGIDPAGALYTTVDDLARFWSALFAGGRGANGEVLQPATLDSMLAPQFADAGADARLRPRLRPGRARRPAHRRARRRGLRLRHHVQRPAATRSSASSSSPPRTRPTR